jgi:hypothetical protein
MDNLHFYYNRTYEYYVRLKDYFDWLDAESDVKLEELCDDIEFLEKQNNFLDEMEDKENE